VLWQDGFREEGGALTLTMANTAYVAVGLICLLIFTTILTALLRQAERDAQIECTHEFAVTVARVDRLIAEVDVDDPAAALAGFAQAGQSLVESLSGVGPSLELVAKPFTESLEHSQRVMSQMIESQEQQAEKLDQLVELLGSIATIGDKLDGVQTESARSASALEEVAGGLGTATGDLVGAVEVLGGLSRQIERATATLTSSVEDAKPFATSLDVSQRVMSRMIDGQERQSSKLDELAELLASVATIGDKLAALHSESARSTQALEGVADGVGTATHDLGESLTALGELARQIERATSVFTSGLSQVESASQNIDDAAQKLNDVANRFMSAAETTGR